MTQSNRDSRGSDLGRAIDWFKEQAKREFPIRWTMLRLDRTQRVRYRRRAAHMIVDRLGRNPIEIEWQVVVPFLKDLGLYAPSTYNKDAAKAMSEYGQVAWDSLRTQGLSRASPGAMAVDIMRELQRVSEKYHEFGIALESVAGRVNDMLLAFERKGSDVGTDA